MGLSNDKRADILSVISKRGQNPVQGNIYNMMAIWLSWFRSNVNDFHFYNLKLADSSIKRCERMTLNMGKRVPEDWTKLLYNKNVNVVLDSFEEEKSNEDKEFYLKLNKDYNDILENNNFEVEYSNILEKAFALGTSAMVEFSNNDEILIDFIIGDMLIISSYRNQQVSGLVTVNVMQHNDETITHLTFHDLIEGKYFIEHVVFVSTDVNLLGKSASSNITRVFSQAEANEMSTMVEVKDDEGKVIRTEERHIVTFDTDIVHFQIIKPNIVNNFDLENPMGLSVFANAIDQLKGGDTWYDAFINEPEKAKYRIVVDSETMLEEIQKTTSDSDGNVVVQTLRPFNSQDTTFVGANLSGHDKAIEFYGPAIRSDDLVKGINMNMQLLGFNCGMGTDYYAFDARGVYQNEKAVVSENSDLWSNKVKHEITAITQPLTGMTKAILFLMREKGLWSGDIDQIKITVQTDDSMATDDETILQHMKEDATDSFIPEWRYVAKRYKLSEVDAKQWVAEAKVFEEVELDLGLTPNDGEPEEAFIQRFMNDEEMILEFPDDEQRREVAQERFTNSGS